jgi:Chemoreceptor zinc-binding domain
MDEKLKKQKIDAAVSAHFSWFDRLKKAIATKQSEFKPEIVAKDNECEFGKWIYSDLRSICAPNIFTEIKTTHAAFHKKASEALSLALQGKTKEAEERIAFGGELVKLSGQLVLLLKKI